ncbi:substrate-binding domain-containing protein [Phycisphaera mikurensis]|uniref:Putative LacI family transcriptional regulator n=1 Tax=Phycisphaera mikurensis (strain NBRC 102666 / KCTC 22515 / FYK2301M01) TaxID=1142394 RepID=I0IIU5_PHYMF|nr:LacI family DNA-binding transcriptional regulator [Phycisphaera mikurensis]MBB6443411.1 LacI family transcriptional regulator [Phycisphaera mikurensis]BAM05183.1 putative LacI family transcriptional regulator [Phycisphaera mikurensis NBRC 102666]
MSVTKVAELAGVSRMTVSRVINDDPRVKPETARGVRLAIAELGYVPPSASDDGRRSRSGSVAGRHTGRIAVLIPDTSADAMRTTLTGRLLHGIDGPVGRNKLQLLLTRLPRERALPASIDRRQVDGVIVRASDSAWVRRALRKMPVVWVFDSDTLDDACDCVDADDEAIGRLAAEHLIAAGHRRLASINEIAGHASYARRLRAFAGRAREAGIEARAAEVPGRDQAAIDRRVAGLLRQKPRGGGTDGLFLPGVGPMVACVQRAVRAAGREPGVEAGLIGCGHDRHVIEAMHPQPANIDIQAEAIGAAAAELLLWRLANPGAPARRRVIAPRLVPGATPA